MAKRRAGEVAEDLAAVVDFVRCNTNGARSGEIAAALKDIPQRTIQRWLKGLVEDGRLAQEGKGPAARYLFPGAIEAQRETIAREADPGAEKREAILPLSVESTKIRGYPNGGSPGATASSNWEPSAPSFWAPSVVRGWASISAARKSMPAIC